MNHKTTRALQTAFQQHPAFRRSAVDDVLTRMDLPTLAWVLLR